MNDRGISISFTHALTLGMTSILIISLLFGVGNLLEDQQQRAAQRQLTDVGGQVLEVIGTVDRLNETGNATVRRLESEFPERITGEPYTVALRTGAGGETTLYLNMSGRNLRVAMTVANDTRIVDSSTVPGDLTVYLCHSSGRATISLEGETCS